VCLDRIRDAEIQDFAAKTIEKKRSKKTVNNCLTVVRRLLVVAKKRELLEAAGAARAPTRGHRSRHGSASSKTVGMPSSCSMASTAALGDSWGDTAQNRT
jgi:hypothetical protein